MTTATSALLPANKAPKEPKIDKEQEALLLNQERIQILVAEIKQAKQLRNIAGRFSNSIARNIATKKLGMNSSKYKLLQNLLTGYESLVGQFQSYGIEEAGIIDTIILSLPEEYLFLGIQLPQDVIETLVTAAQSQIELLPSACEKIILEGLAKQEIGSDIKLDKPHKMAGIKKLLAALNNCPPEWKELISEKAQNGNEKKAVKLTASWQKIQKVGEDLDLAVDPTQLNSPELAAKVAKVVARAKSLLSLSERAQALDDAKEKTINDMEALIAECETEEIKDFITELGNKL